MARKLDHKQDEAADRAWLGLGDTNQFKHLQHDFEHLGMEGREDPARFYLRHMRKPENFGFTIKHVLGMSVLPEQLAILKLLWTHPFPMFIAARGFGKTFSLALYSILLAVFKPGSKIIIAGAGFRQSKMVFEAIENIWFNAPVLKDLCGAATNKRQGPAKEPDKWIFRMGASTITALPIGHDGSKIRGFRASNLLIDEFATINPEVYETVLAGFASVSLSPVENVKRLARLRALEDMGYDIGTSADEVVRPNQIVLSGTAYWSFNHFHSYWKKYHNIIASKGDPYVLKNLLGEEADINHINYKDYCIIRIPYELVPPGFMDPKQIARSQATMDSMRFNMEYNCIFARDSQGFFSRKLIENCVTSKPITRRVGPVQFEPSLRGDPHGRYVIGVDPASEVDNFAVVVLELHPDHRRVVYAWTTRRSLFKIQKAKRETLANDFYGHCTRKIRQLIKQFPCAAIALDSQGSVAIQEALENTFGPDEMAILPIIDPDEPKLTDSMDGLKIIHLISFANYEWTAGANQNMKKDLEQQELLFPAFDHAGIVMAMEYDEAQKQLKGETGYTESLESCISEIEDLKDEMSTIVVSVTPTGRERWDTPEIKTESGKKGRLRKDRYSALLMANAVAREIMAKESRIDNIDFVGGMLHKGTAINRKDQKSDFYAGPDDFREASKHILRMNMNMRKR